MRKTLIELVHLQPRTPIQIDNRTVDDLINNKIVTKSTKSIDIQFHWIRVGIAKGNSATFGGQDILTSGIIGRSTILVTITKLSV